MILHKPFIISSRLMPALVIGGATLSLSLPDRHTRGGRDIYEAWIDLPDGSEHEITDLHSGRQGGSVLEGFSSLLSFLAAAGESRNYRERTGRTGEHEDLFPEPVTAWAADHEDDLSSMSYEIEESDTSLIEE